MMFSMGTSIPSWLPRWRRQSAASPRKRSTISNRHAHDRAFGPLTHAGVAGKRIVRVAAIALEEGAGLDSEGFVQNVSFDVGRGAEQDLVGTDAAIDPATHGYVLGVDLTVDDGLVADDE